MVMKLLSVLFVSLIIVLVSGCVDSTDSEMNTQNLSLKSVIVENLPDGFEYLGMHKVEVSSIQQSYADVEGIVNASEAFYRFDSVDYFVVGVEMSSADNALNFVTQYKASFKPLVSGGRFQEVSVNGHNATRILKYSMVGGEHVPRYNYVWSNENFVFIAGGNTDEDSVVLSLAKAIDF